MSIEFHDDKCQSESDSKVFGLCDDPSPSQNPAYIDNADGSKWIAVVENEYRRSVTFTAIDNCINLRDADGKMQKRCDGMLTFNTTVIFVELKERRAKGNAWVVDAELQLNNTILHFEKTDISKSFNQKKAYISNREHPKFKASQKGRMDKFYQSTGYVLRIQARIRID